jgi:hypothetical protein
MKKNLTGWKKFIALVLSACLLAAAFTACQKEQVTDSPDPAPPELTGCAIRHELEFGGVYIEIKIDDFNKLGFQYGDSVNVEFSNGYKLEDLPYYNGYYVDAGEALLIAYPGYDFIKAAINYGADLWEEGALYAGKKEDLFQKALLDEHCTASIFLKERGKYLDVQQARDIHYYDEREKYPSDEVFANFRNVFPGNIKEGVLYRSASPCDNQHNRAEYVNTLIDVAGVKCILDLADDDAKIQGYLENADLKVPAFRELYAAGKVIPLALNTNFTSEGFRAKLADGLIRLSEQPGPYYVHCTEGKDRTGFVCLLLEALCGASYDEIRKDYMTTYDNYYGITEQTDPARYKTIVDHVLNPMVNLFAGGKALETADLQSGAEQYLTDCGMTADQIEALRAALSE